MSGCPLQPQDHGQQHYHNDEQLHDPVCEGTAGVLVRGLEVHHSGLRVSECGLNVDVNAVDEGALLNDQVIELLVDS